ncbi:MAG: sugar ABC transporter permease, partial [Clostridia bacterium]|nr:sugar ABC transporter permease [Clostridia bacterium]
MSSQNKKGLTLAKKHNLTGWVFLLPATLLIAVFSFWPMIQAFILSLQTGMGMNLTFKGFSNYFRILKDPTFKQTLFNTFFYLIIQVPVMLILALALASMLNNKQLRFKGVFRTAIFLPCATSLVSYAMIFRSMFAVGGFVNVVLMKMGIIAIDINWINGSAITARAVIIVALIWRWTGYN